MNKKRKQYIQNKTLKVPFIGLSSKFTNKRRKRNIFAYEKLSHSRNSEKVTRKYEHDKAEGSKIMPRIFNQNEVIFSRKITYKIEITLKAWG